MGKRALIQTKRKNKSDQTLQDQRKMNWSSQLNSHLDMRRGLNLRGSTSFTLTWPSSTNKHSPIGQYFFFSSPDLPPRFLLTLRSHLQCGARRGAILHCCCSQSLLSLSSPARNEEGKPCLWPRAPKIPGLPAHCLSDATGCNLSSTLSDEQHENSPSRLKGTTLGLLLGLRHSFILCFYCVSNF